RLVSPGKFLLLDAAASRVFPLRLGGKAEAAAPLDTQPIAVASGFVPRHRRYGLAGMIEVAVFPERWRLSRRRTEKTFVLGIGDLGGGEKEGINPDPVDRALAVLSAVGTHQEPALRDKRDCRFG